MCHVLNISHFSLERGAFDNKTVSFEEHFRMEHNLWHYLYFIVLIKVKDPTEFTGPESYVYEMVKVITFSLQNTQHGTFVLEMFRLYFTQ